MAYLPLLLATVGTAELMQQVVLTAFEDAIASGRHSIITAMNGGELAAVVPMDEMRFLLALLDEYEDRRDADTIRDAEADPDNQRLIPLADFMDIVALGDSMKATGDSGPAETLSREEFIAAFARAVEELSEAQAKVQQ